MRYPRQKLLNLALLSEGTLLGLALLLATLFDIPLFQLSGNLSHDIVSGTVWGLLPVGLFIFSLSLNADKIPLLASLRRTMIKEVRPLFANTRLIDIILISLSAGIAEEVFFRGILQAEFGIIAASVLFGLAHCITPAYIVVATVMGFYIGLFFNRYGLLVPIQIHFVYDMGALIYLRYYVTGEEIATELNEAD